MDPMRCIILRYSRNPTPVEVEYGKTEPIYREFSLAECAHPRGPHKGEPRMRLRVDGFYWTAPAYVYDNHRVERETKRGVCS
jgi:hypothetical protein